MRRLSSTLASCVFGLALTAQIFAGEANVRIARVFNDHMVLQREMNVPVWGWAKAGSDVKVSFAGQEKSTRAKDDGYWRVNLDPLKTAGAGQVLTIASDGQTIRIKDVLVGEVWFCAGQSNMACTLGQEQGNYPELKARTGAVDFPNIRYLQPKGFAAKEPLKDLDPAAQSNRWLQMDQKTVRNSMTMPFFFARTIQAELDVPVGLIQVAIGGTTQTSWSPKEVLEKVAQERGSKLSYDFLYKESVARLASKKSRGKDAPKSWEEFEKGFAAWKQKPEGRNQAGAVKHFPSVLHNAMVAPFVPFRFRGMLWHQGCGGPVEKHPERMVALVSRWRELFEHKFDYFYGALGRGTTVSPPLEPIAQSHYRIGRNQQFVAAQKLFGFEDKAFFVDFSDRGNFETHWGEKDKGGYQFANAALNHVYGKPQVFTGPLCISHEIKSGEARLTFKYADSGLVYKPSIDGISGFLLVNKDGALWLEPVIEGKNTVILRHPKITDKSNIHYGQCPNPHETLFNKEGFHASVINIINNKLARTPKQTVSLVSTTDKKYKKQVNITHVRRNVFVFDIYEKPGKADNRSLKVTITLPKEWPEAGIQHEGKDIQIPAVKDEPKGYKSLELEVKVNEQYVVYSKVKAAEAMKEVDLTRF